MFEAFLWLNQQVYLSKSPTKIEFWRDIKTGSA
jgi:hypothetical protein